MKKNEKSLNVLEKEINKLRWENKETASAMREYALKVLEMGGKNVGDWKYLGDFSYPTIFGKREENFLEKFGMNLDQNKHLLIEIPNTDKEGKTLVGSCIRVVFEKATDEN